MKIYYSICIISLFGCIESKQPTDANIEVIKIPETPEEKVQSTEYFNNYEIIPLETNSNSLLSSIDKIALFDSKIYILDDNVNTLYIFSEKGEFLNKINHQGKGPNEYLSVSYFSIDEPNRQLILFCDRPGKYMFYNLEGGFMNEVNVDVIDRTFEVLGDHIIQFNYRNPVYKYYFSVYKRPSLEFIYEKMKIPDYVRDYSSQGTIYPNSNQSLHTYFYSPLDYNIFKVTQDGITVGYRLDFQKNNIPESFFDRNIPPKQLYQTCKSEGYGFYISNFRETDDYIIFKYEPSIMVIYNKIEKSSRAIKTMMNPSIGVDIGNYFAHEGKGNDIITIHTSQMLKHFLTDDILPDKNMQELVSKLEYSDNPVLIRYHFK